MMSPKMKNNFLTLLFLLSCASFSLAESECPSANVTFFYSTEGNKIQGIRLVSEVKEDLTPITIDNPNAQIKALAYDHKHMEFLFVNKETPNHIYGVNQAIGVHTVVNWPSANFKTIVVDPVTDNIYFTQNGRGIGVCSGHGEDVNCTILVNAVNSSSVYKDLILHPKRGLMFWLENQTVKIGSMDGKHVRTLKNLGTVYGLAFNPQTDRLFISQGSTISKFMLENHSIEHAANYSAMNIFIVNCYVYSFEGFNDLVLKPVMDEILTSKDKNFRDVANVLVLDTDKKHQPNPCKQFDCDGICVLSETFPSPEPTCIKVYGNVGDKSTNDRTNSLSTFSIIIISILLLVLILMFLALIIRFDVCSKLRDCIRSRDNKCHAMDKDCSSYTFKSTLAADDI